MLLIKKNQNLIWQSTEFEKMKDLEKKEGFIEAKVIDDKTEKKELF